MGDALKFAAKVEGVTLGIETVVVTTRGDLALGESLRALGPGAFTHEVDDALLSNNADIAVHSLKDAPPVSPAGLTLAACLPREDARDAVILKQGYSSLGDLPAGSIVGTSSSRRRAQILASYPHLQVVPLRGSVQTRLSALKEEGLSATLLALSGLKRLAQEHLASQVLSEDVMLPAACQGAIGAMCRTSDTEMLRWLAHACHVPTLLEVTTERACVQQLMGVPPSMPAVAVACRATVMDNKEASIMADDFFKIELDCLVASEDGSRVHRLHGCCTAGSDTDMQLDAAHSLGARYGQLLRDQASQWV